MQPVQESSNIPALRQPTVCFRISNVPSTWGKDELVEAIQSLDEPLSVSADYTLSLHPACHGSSQTALLELERLPNHLSSLRTNESKRIGREDLDLVVDRHFYGLTPLNTPEGGIVAE